MENMRPETLDASLKVPNEYLQMSAEKPDFKDHYSPNESEESSGTQGGDERDDVKGEEVARIDDKATHEIDDQDEDCDLNDENGQVGNGTSNDNGGGTVHGERLVLGKDGSTGERVGCFGQTDEGRDWALLATTMGSGQ
jgi:hypothetical protein